MGIQVKLDFPEINFKKSVMVGDSISDLIFGKKLGMYSVMINKKGVSSINSHFCYNSLLDFALSF